jgi:hypothetical protein
MQPDHAGDGQEVLSAAAWETVSMTASDTSTRARAIVRPVRGLESLFLVRRAIGASEDSMHSRLQRLRLEHTTFSRDEGVAKPLTSCIFPDRRLIPVT